MGHSAGPGAASRELPPSSRGHGSFLLRPANAGTTAHLRRGACHPAQVCGTPTESGWTVTCPGAGYLFSGIDDGREWFEAGQSPINKPAWRVACPPQGPKLPSALPQRGNSDGSEVPWEQGSKDPQPQRGLHRCDTRSRPLRPSCGIRGC